MPHRYNHAERLLQAQRLKEPVACFRYQVDGQVMTLEQLGKHLGAWLVRLAESKTREGV